MPIIRRDERRWPARLAGVAPGALLTALMLLVFAGSVRSRAGWLRFGERPTSRATERVDFATPPSAVRTARRASTAARAPSAAAPTTNAVATAPPAPPARSAAAAGPPPGEERAPRTAPGGVDPRLAGPRGYVPPDVARPPLRLGTPRPDHAPLDSARRDSALADLRSDLSALALRGRIPIGTDDAGKALASVGAAGLSSRGRRELARAAIVDWQRRDAEAQLQEKGRRPALTVGFPLSFGGPRKPALSDAEVRAMVERNAARVRRRADSLRWWAESTRVARERTMRDAAARDSAARGAAPEPGDV